MWSALNNVLLRIGSLLFGVALARLLTPEEFGIYAVGLTVQTVLMTVADLGLGADLVRSPDHERRAPTVATLGVLSGVTLAISLALAAGPLAHLLGSPGSTAVILVMSMSLVFTGLGVVPWSYLSRDFRQKELFFVAAIDLVVSSAVTLVLIAFGWGAVSLAVGRVVAQAMCVALQFMLAGRPPRFGWEQTLVPAVLAFGVPLAAANLLSWALLGVDKVVLSRLAGPTTLGYYVLAFNISTWPMSGIGQVVRSISLPAFVRAHETPHGERTSLATAAGLAWCIALPAGVLLAVLAKPLVLVVYGRDWLPAAAALAGLGLFGALRVMFDLFAAYLTAVGRARSVLLVQVLWIVVLPVVLVLATLQWRTSGAAWAHVVVAVGVVVPAYLHACRAAGAETRALLWQLWPPALGVVPAAALAHYVSASLERPWLSLCAGGSAGCVLYLILMRRWFLQRLRMTRAGTPVAEPSTKSAQQPP